MNIVSERLQQALQMKINHNQNSLSSSKLHSITSLPLPLTADTSVNVAYANTALILTNATNLNELQNDDNIFSEKLPIYTHHHHHHHHHHDLLSPLSIDASQQCMHDVIVTTTPTAVASKMVVASSLPSAPPSPPLPLPLPLPLSPTTFESSDNHSSTIPPHSPQALEPTEIITSVRSRGRRPPLSYENRFLSLSISPPLTRRQDMPVLRGTFVSL